MLVSVCAWVQWPLCCCTLCRAVFAWACMIGGCNLLLLRWMWLAVAAQSPCLESCWHVSKFCLSLQHEVLQRHVWQEVVARSSACPPMQEITHLVLSSVCDGILFIVRICVVLASPCFLSEGYSYAAPWFIRAGVQLVERQWIVVQGEVRRPMILSGRSLMALGSTGIYSKVSTIYDCHPATVWSVHKCRMHSIRYG
jgi:hypothetical protein